MAATSDILIGAGDIIFGDEDTSAQTSRLFIDPVAPIPDTLNIEGSGAGVLANILGLVPNPSDITAATSKQYVDNQTALRGDVFGPASATINSVPVFSTADGKTIDDATDVEISGGTLTANTGNIVATLGDVTAGNQLSAPTVNITGTSGNTLITTSSTTVNLDFILPSEQGTSGTFLQNDGSGNLIWAVPSGLQFSDDVKTAEPPNGNNITLAPAPAQVNGYTLVSGDLVLLMAQTNPVDNGIYGFDGTNLVRPTSGIYAVGGDVTDAVTFVEDGGEINTSYVQTAQPQRGAIVGTTALTYSKFAAAPQAKGPQFAIQFADPEKVFAGESNFTWDRNTLNVSGPTGNITATGTIQGNAVNSTTTVTAGTGVTATTGDIVATAGNVTAGATVSGNAVNSTTTVTAGTGVTATTGDIVATAGAVNAGTTVTAGTGVTATTGNLTATAGDLVLQNTTVSDGAGAAQSIALPDNTGNATDFVLAVDTSGSATTTKWLDISAKGDVFGPASATINSIPVYSTADGKTITDATDVEIVGGTLTANTGDLVATAGNVTAGATVSGNAVDSTTTVTAGTGVTATTGDIVATVGNVTAGATVSGNAVDSTTTVTAGTGVTATTGDIVATAGAVNAGTTVTSGTGVTATTGDIVATVGNVTAGATVSGNAVDSTTTVTAGTGVTATTGNLTATAGDLVLQNTTVSDGAGAAQSIALPDNTGNATDFVLAVDTSGSSTTTKWLDISAKGDVFGPASATINSIPVYSTADGKTITDATDVEIVGGTLTANTGDLVATAGNVTAGATVSGTTVTDGTLVVNSGSITNGVEATFSGRVTAQEVKTTSDATLKTNIALIDNPLDNIKKIEGYSYNWKENQEGPEIFGVLAQQLEDAGMENLVSVDYNGHKCVDYNQLIPLLIGGMKQMAKEIEELKSNAF